jgi:gliding motility-associated-like protein
MKKTSTLRNWLVYCFLLFLFCTSIQAQPGKNGALTVTTAGQVLNQYSRVTANITAGTNTVSVNNLSADLGGLACGDLVMVMQMQGASIITTDNASYGGISSYNNAGMYELKYVTSVSGNTFQVDGTFANSYTASGNVQVIKVPQYTTLTINAAASVIAAPWNGQTGGVVALAAQSTITVNGAINVDTLGFRGGALDNVSALVTNPVFSSYFSNLPSRGGEKGEGIAGYQSEYDALGGRYGRGAPANGGGGGNTHNAGGGGGANGNNSNAWNGQGVMIVNAANPLAAWALDPSYVANGNSLTASSGGGRGGYSRSELNADATSIAPGNALWGPNNRYEVGGLGGRPLTANAADRIFLGGGGGAGDANSNSGGPGGSGGGIIYLLANTVNGTGVLSANGRNGYNTRGQNIDAPSGGGAGGSIVVNATTLTSLAITANGGNGGSQGSPTIPFEAEGPGGGGGGGYVAVPAGASATIAVNAGTNGTTASAALTEFPANGATAGNTGLQTTLAASTPVLTVNACAKPTLTITKRVESSGPILAGNARSLYYTVQVINTGPGTATGVEIRDNLASMGAGITFTGNTFRNLDGGASQSPGPTPTGGATNLVFGNYTLPPNSAVELLFQVDFSASLPVGTYNNSAQVFFDDPTSGISPKVTPGGLYNDGTTVGGSNYNGTSSTLEDVIVTNTNTPPVATNNSYTTRQSLLVYGNVILDGTPDSDPDVGNTIAIEGLPTYNTAQGSLILADNGQFSFLPAPGFTGTFLFTYRVSDNATPALISNVATVTIQVNALPDYDGDGISDIADLDDDNDGILDIMEAGCPGVGVINTGVNLISNGNFNQGVPTALTPVPEFVLPGNSWGGGTWTSGVPYNGYNVYPTDTRIAIQRGVVTYAPIIPSDPAVPQYSVPSGFRVVQGPFGGDAPFGVSASDTYLYSNGNSLGTAYVICRQTVSGLIPGRDYILVSYTSNAINPLLDATNAPEDAIMQFYVDGNPVGEGYVVYKDGDPRSGHGGVDLWDRRQVVFRATAPTAVFELRDAQLGINGDDFVITYAGVFPYNDYSCASLPADPSGDEDGDGVPNWQDPDDPALGTVGLNALGIRTIYASLDPDGDGLISQFDLDSDGDGCFDAREAGQSTVTVNANGTVGPSGVNVAFGNNGFLNTLELLSTTGGNSIETGTMNYTAASTTGTYNFLNNTIFSACSPNGPVAQNITRYIRRNTTANPSSYTLTQSEFQSVFSDADGDTFQSLIIRSLPTDGTLTYNGTPVVIPPGGLEIPVANIGQLIFTPIVDAAASYPNPYATFGFKVRESSSVISINTYTYTFITVDLVAVDDLPTSTPVTTVNTGTSVTIDALANDTRIIANNTNLTVVSQSNPCFTVSVVNNGTASPTFSVAAGICPSGTYTFVYNFRDNVVGLTSNNATVTFTIVNPPVIPVAKTVITTVNTAYTFSQTAGQSGTPDFAVTGGTGTLQSIIISQLPAAGTLTLNGTPVTLNQEIPVAQIPNLVFTPAADGFGVVPPYTTFQYQGKDSAGNVSTTPGIITIQVVKAQDDVAVNIGSPIAVLSNDAFPTGATIAVSIASQPSCGTVTVNAFNQVTYTPPAAGCAEGPDSFTYSFTITLPGGQTVVSNVATVTFTHEAPDLVTNQPYTVTTAVNANRPFTIADFPVATGSPAVTEVVITSLPTNGSLWYDSGSGPVQLTSLPATGLSIPVAQIGNLQFRPDANESAVPYATFDFALANIGTRSPVATMTVNVIEAKDDPTPATPATPILAVQGTTISIPVLANDIIIAATPTTLVIASPSDPCFTASVTNNGTSNPTISFNTAACPAGVYTFTYTITQNGATTPPATVSVTVVPDKPILNPGATVTVTFPEDNKVGTTPAPETFADPSDTFLVQLSAAFNYPPVAGLLTQMQIATLPAKGTLKLNGTAVTIGQIVSLADLNQLVYEPVPNESRTPYVQFSVSVAGAVGQFSDAAVPVIINITPVQDPPLAQNDFNVTERNKAVVGNALSNDSDPDTPYTGDTLSATPETKATSQPGGQIVIESDGTYTYTPPTNFVGIDSVRYTVCDNFGNCSQGLIVIVVNPPAVDGNKAPIARDDNYTTIQNQPIVGTAANSVLVNDSDPNGDPLTVTAVTNAATAQGGLITINAQGVFSYTPKADFVGVDTYTYIVCDSKGLCVAANITILVNPPLPGGNRAPIAQNDFNRTNIDIPLVISAGAPAPTNLLTNDSDPDGHPISILPVNNLPTTQDGRITINANGTYTYTPRTGFLGTDTYTYTVCDDRDPKGCATATLFITINIPPVALAISDTLVNPNRPSPPEPSGKPMIAVVLDKKLTGTDEDGTVDAFAISTLPLHGKLYYKDDNTGAQTEVTAAGTQLSVAEANTLVYEPVISYSGLDSFDYQAIDNEGAISPKVTYQLLIINRPIALDDAIKVVPNTPNVPIYVASNDSDPDDEVDVSKFSKLDSTTVRIIKQPTFGTATVTNGVISYTSTTRNEVKDTIVYVICDITPTNEGLGKTPLCDTAIVVIDVKKPFIPDGFTPNGDQQHDYFVIENPNNDQISLKIFNRWGNLVYESDNFKSNYNNVESDFPSATSDWNGRANRGMKVGDELPDGTYFYVIKFKNSGYNVSRYMTIVR